jgi:hypothetical protein
LAHLASDHYVWTFWASAFLIPWLALYAAFPRHRRTMLWVSAMTAPFGLTEPLFVPEYWNPPSLFDLAQRTGFDFESLIFFFAIGGVAVSFYRVLTGRSVEAMTSSISDETHRCRVMLLVPVLAFPALMLAPSNPIYPAIIAMLLGAVLCRPDLTRNTGIGGGVFLIYYLIFMPRMVSAGLYRPSLEPARAIGDPYLSCSIGRTPFRFFLRRLLGRDLRASRMETVRQRTAK